MELKLNDIKDKEIFKKLLRSGIVIFEYQKKDKTKRHASGTLYSKILEKKIKNFNEHHDSKKKGNNATPTQLTYYDLTVDGWRSPHLVGQTIKIKDVFVYGGGNTPNDKRVKRIVEINNRLQEIYDWRETLKKRKKEFLKVGNLLKTRYEENTPYHKAVDDKLENIKAQRQALRIETKHLKKEKAELFSK